MRIDLLLLCFGVPALLVGLYNRFSYLKLKENLFIQRSPTWFKVFIYSRLIYWYIFAVMITAFLTAMVMFNANGNQTRQIIAYKHAGIENIPAFIIGGQISTIFLPLIFITLFVAMVALGVIGKAVLKQMPEEGRLEERFTRFRFTFVLLSLSLVLPPLLFGSLLTL